METIEMRCLNCGNPVNVEKGGLEEQGIFNVFCKDKRKNCEDRYAFKQ